MIKFMGDARARWMSAAAAGAMLVTGLTAIAASPAAAAEKTGFAGVTTSTVAAAPVGNCAAGYHCVYYLGFSSAKYSFFNTDGNFADNTFSNGASVNNNTVSAANSSTGNYESHYYDGTGTSGFLFCINPGRQVEYIPSGLQNRASALQLRPRTSVACLA